MQFLEDQLGNLVENIVFIGPEQLRLRLSSMRRGALVKVIIQG